MDQYICHSVQILTLENPWNQIETYGIKSFCFHQIQIIPINYSQSFQEDSYEK